MIRNPTKYYWQLRRLLSWGHVSGLESLEMTDPGKLEVVHERYAGSSLP